MPQPSECNQKYSLLLKSINLISRKLVLVHNQRGMSKWMTGRILQQKAPVSYLVTVGSRIRYCYVNRLLKSKVMPEGNAEVVAT